ncbi:hypothetical protein E308F_16400 [Moorella sp. E308F]|uniref:type VII toxin-antitoxin system HepT family RNase toxin n=1 Tax=unclassified Neomoorella TaxID=2676739 RepID=UPI0010FFC445|nr:MULTISPECIES: DUF86 domain-containing protein [unclassified Moorella (in: firmicutes)]GEA15396.1 hypothetical protein E308F_16400 [Moorella sp. E308F]GEA19744.1 hypothetical protein E306M_28830 [Moorella sp. E306M]
MVDIEVIRHRLALLSEYIADLEAEKEIGLKDFLADKRLRRYAERTLHLAIESCIDIASHIISDEGLREPRDNKDIFAVLGEAGYLPEELAKKLMKMAQFRNIIVHDYTQLDAEVIWGILKRDLGDLHHFMLTIKERLGIG